MTMLDRLLPYPPRWWLPVIRIMGGPQGEASRRTYLYRLALGRLYVHWFCREDMDRDPHDHPFEYWTFPLMGYTERVFRPESHCFEDVHVSAWRWSYRAATHCHQITRTDSGRWPLITIVWRGRNVRRWGFWCYELPAWRSWVWWKSYHYATGSDPGAESTANRPGDHDDTCPGAR